MPVILFKLRNVPDDEADEVRALMDDNGIEYYETNAGPWGISVPALWLHDETQLPLARALLDRYQAQRAAEQRALYEQSRRAGTHKTMRDTLFEHPVRFVVYLLLIAAVLYLSLAPFLRFGR